MADEDAPADGGPDLDADDIDSLEAAANEQAGATPEQSAPAEDAAPPADSEAAATADDAPGATATAAPPTTGGDSSAEELLAQAESNLDRVLSDDLQEDTAPHVDKAAGATPFEFGALPGSGGVVSGPSTLPIDALDDVELDLRIELGRTELLIEDVVKLGEGSIVQLDKLAGDPVDVLVNGRLIARGEVLVLNDNFCIRVVEIMAPEAA